MIAVLAITKTAPAATSLDTPTNLLYFVPANSSPIASTAVFANSNAITPPLTKSIIRYSQTEILNIIDAIKTKNKTTKCIRKLGCVSSANRIPLIAFLKEIICLL